MSGTGPKAGGPLYLRALVAPRRRPVLGDAEPLLPAGVAATGAGLRHGRLRRS